MVGLKKLSLAQHICSNFLGIHPFAVYHNAIDKRTDVNHIEVLLVSSIYTTNFGRTDHSQTFKSIIKYVSALRFNVLCLKLL